MVENALAKIDQIVAQANKAYALVNYEEAADKYAEASQACSLEYGEGNPRNADVLFLYGRTLFKLAMQKSEVLGGAGPAEPQAASEPANGKLDSNKFSFEGDDGDDDDGDDVPEQAPVEAEEDHFQAAWEVLDLARVSCQKQLDNDDFKDKLAIRRRLADTYDLLGEIALENGMQDSISC